MRLVKVFKWAAKIEEGTGRRFMDKEPDGEAVFHQFGVDYEEFETGAGNFSTAIIERADGTIQTPQASMIQFIEDASTAV